jgi:hypothetical protein
MNASSITSGNTVLNALAKGVCPICSLVRAFQNELIEHLHPDDATAVCNYHAWAIAASLRGVGREKSSNEQGCGLCSSIREHEVARLRELATEMCRTRFAQWLEQHGTLCHFHAASLQSMVPEEYARIITRVIRNNQQQLEALLASFAAKARSGEHAGGGVLGRAAEFLVAQRGLTR